MANALTPFFGSYTEVLPASGQTVHVDAAGSYFYCKEATGRFKMRFDNGRWFEFDQSFYFRLDQPFSSVEFQALITTADTTIEFYVCSREMGAHLNVIRNPNNFQSFQYLVAQTLVKGWSRNSINGGEGVIFYGTGGLGATQAGGAYSFRKAIIVTNNDSSNLLEIWNSDQTRRVGSVQPLKAWYLETSDDLVVKNETLSAMNVRVSELFYPASIVEAVTNPTGTPVLTDDGTNHRINWTWTGAVPPGWRIESSPDGLTAWSEVTIVAGFTNTWSSGSTGVYYRITAVDGEDNPITAYSNVVSWA